MIGLLKYILDETNLALEDLRERRLDLVEARLKQIKETAERGKDEQEERRLESGYESRGVLRKDR